MAPDVDTTASYEVPFKLTVIVEPYGSSVFVEGHRIAGTGPAMGSYPAPLTLRGHTKDVIAAIPELREVHEMNKRLLKRVEELEKQHADQ